MGPQLLRPPGFPFSKIQRLQRKPSQTHLIIEASSPTSLPKQVFRVHHTKVFPPVVGTVLVPPGRSNMVQRSPSLLASAPIPASWRAAKLPLPISRPLDSRVIVAPPKRPTWRPAEGEPQGHQGQWQAPPRAPSR